MSKLVFIVLGMVLYGSLQAQQVCQDNIHATTPTSEFTFNGDGTVTHLRTGLMWKQCLEGQNGANCEGTPATFNFSPALEHAKSASSAGHKDWRLPSIRELASIIETACAKPAINPEVFPSNPEEISIWSNTLYSPSISNGTGGVYTIWFSRGQSFASGTLNIPGVDESGLRLVRDQKAQDPKTLPPESVKLCNAISDGPHHFYLADGREVIVPSGECLITPLLVPSMGMSIWECIWNEEKGEYDCAFESYTIKQGCTYEVVKDWPPSCCGLSVHELGCIAQ